MALLGGLQVRMDDGAAASDDGGLQDLVLEVGGEGALLVREQGRQGHQVARIERAGVGGVKAKAEALPFADASLDAVTCVYLFHELPPRVRPLVAASLARRGGPVQVLDAAAEPAGGASALPVGLFAPHVSPDDAILSRLTRAGVQATLAQARALLREGLVDELLLQHEHLTDTQTTLDTDAEATAASPPTVEPLTLPTQAELEQRSGMAAVGRDEDGRGVYWSLTEHQFVAGRRGLGAGLLFSAAIAAAVSPETAAGLRISVRANPHDPSSTVVGVMAWPLIGTVTDVISLYGHDGQIQCPNPLELPAASTDPRRSHTTCSYHGSSKRRLRRGPSPPGIACRARPTSAAASTSPGRRCVRRCAASRTGASSRWCPAAVPSLPGQNRRAGSCRSPRACWKPVASRWTGHATAPKPWTS